MSRSNTEKQRNRASVIFFCLIIVASGAVFASGTGHHHDDQTMSEHMRSMMTVKESIPEEFRIMVRTPIPADPESLQKGRALFMQHCSVCHGANGDGKGPAAAALNTPPANFLDRQHSAIYSPGEKYWIIAHGSTQTGMPAFTQISPLERWHLVNHILLLQKNSSAK